MVKLAEQYKKVLVQIDDMEKITCSPDGSTYAEADTKKYRELLTKRDGLADLIARFTLKRDMDLANESHENLNASQMMPMASEIEKRVDFIRNRDGLS